MDNFDFLAALVGTDTALTVEDMGVSRELGGGEAGVSSGAGGDCMGGNKGY